ncbi:MAG: (2Fe-2S)-binding protein [Chloroflexota bacterium]|nr:(2Fe-2S)-binding protein [Chloroflexota bacterium]
MHDSPGPAKIAVRVSVNDVTHHLEVEPRRLLVQLLRDDLGLTGTHIGCDTSQCGACVVHLNGQAIKSCTLLAAQADGMKIVTIEGLAVNGHFDSLQQGFWEMHGLQCGFCTPGMIMSAHALLRDTPNPSEKQIRHGLAGNLCRCTGYHNIIRAVQHAAGHLDNSATQSGSTGTTAEF